jgi:methyl-accepting chemotaxis protein
LIAYFMLRSLSASISEIVKGLSDGSIQVTTASAQIATASEELSQAANEQAASLEQTAASVEQMNSMIMKNTENANSTASLSQKSSSASEKGQAVVAKMIETMSHIDKSNATIMEQVNESNEQIAGIVKVVEQIAKKTQVINDIVNKTELLSFNASVEAARAGEHGKGFAVVAEEVGNLARMSGAAAEEITSLIDGSIESVNKIVRETGSRVSTLIESGKRSVAEGTEVAHECGEVLREIVGNVSSVSAMSGEIATASTEQARGINEITKAMNQLDQMTQQNAATSEECASAAEELSAQAESLKSTVTLLVKTVNGSKAVSAGISLNYESAQKRPEPKGATTQKTNIVKLGTRPLGPPKIAEPVKKVSGDVPAYESDGFKDI